MDARTRILTIGATLVLAGIGLVHGFQDGWHSEGLLIFALTYPLASAVFGALIFAWQRAWWPRIPYVMLTVAALLIIGEIPAGHTSHVSASQEQRMDAVQDTTGTYVTIRLKHLEFQLPENWTHLDADARITIRAGTIGRLARAGVFEAPGEYSFAANLYRRGRTLALMNVRFYPEIDVSQEEVRSMSAMDLQDINALFRESITADFGDDIEIHEWYAVERVQINGMSALVYGYDRAGINDKSDVFRARMVRVFDTHNSFTLTVSYARRMEFLLEPLADYVIRSLRRSTAASASR